MTVELVVALPVLLVVAAIAINACAFFGECAAFDRASHQAVRVHAASPAYRQSAQQSCTLAEADIREALDDSDAEIQVTCSPASFDLMRYTATLECAPTLFGMGLRSRVFGVNMPRLTHEVSYVVDVYKPGVVV
jgi:hypothetical protein